MTASKVVNNIDPTFPHRIFAEVETVPDDAAILVPDDVAVVLADHTNSNKETRAGWQCEVHRASRDPTRSTLPATRDQSKSHAIWFRYKEQGPREAHRASRVQTHIPSYNSGRRGEIWGGPRLVRHVEPCTLPTCIPLARGLQAGPKPLDEKNILRPVSPEAGLMIQRMCALSGTCGRAC